METSIVVAIIAGFVSFIGLVITKEQKVSEFRQAWIDVLRNDVAELMSAINHFELTYLTYKMKNKGKWSPNFIGEHVEITNKIQLLIHRINLRLNPKDSEGIIEELEKLNKILTNPSEMLKDNALENATKNFNDKIHQVLKSEWERVKEGEPWFRFTKWGIVILFVGFLIFAMSEKTLRNQKVPVGKKVIDNNIKINELNISSN